MIKNKNHLLLIGIVDGLTIVLYMLLKSPIILWISNLILMTLIIFKAKFSYFSLKTVLMNYVLIPTFYQYQYGNSYGILELSRLPLHFFDMNLFLIIYNSLCYIWITNTDILSKEKEILQNYPTISKRSTYILSFIAIISVCIAYPNFPFSSAHMENRFEALLPGRAWNHLAIVSMLLCLPNLKKSKMVKFSYVFVGFWFLSHYERVDILGFFMGLLLMWCVNRKLQFKFKNLLLLGTILIPILALLTYMGDYRSGTKSFDIKSLLVHHTVSDISYVYNSGIQHKIDFGFYYGETYIRYIQELIPTVSSSYDVAQILSKRYNTPGGDYLLDEPIINFGIIGVILFQIVEFSILYILMKKKGNYQFFVYVFLIMTIFRTHWYGLAYIETAMIYILPILYFIFIYLNKKKKKLVI